MLRKILDVCQTSSAEGVQSWQTNLIKNILQRKTLSMMNSMPEEESSAVPTQMHVAQSFLVHSTMGEIIPNWSQSKPLLGLVAQGGQNGFDLFFVPVAGEH